MCKKIQIISSLIILSFILFSCASSSQASDTMESDRTSRNRSSENVSEDRMITYTVSLTLSVKNTEETRKILIEQIASNKGFVVMENESYITARIPVENMDNYVNTAKTLGKIERQTKKGVDITDQYRDDVIRLESLKSVRNRYLALLEKANDVKDILLIEKELERINAGIELLEGKIKYAELSAAFSNITVTFGEKTKPGLVGWVFYGLYYGIKWLFVWD